MSHGLHAALLQTSEEARREQVCRRADAIREQAAVDALAAATMRAASECDCDRPLTIDADGGDCEGEQADHDMARIMAPWGEMDEAERRAAIAEGARRILRDSGGPL